jgi:tetratricopeptide (TPR) repeat protein
LYSLYDQAIELLPPFGIGSVNRLGEIYEVALKTYDELIYIDKIHTHPYMQKLILLTKLGRFDDAVQVLQLIGNDAGSYHPLPEEDVYVSFISYKYELAKLDLTGAGLFFIDLIMKKYPQLWIAYYYKAEVLRELVKNEEAEVAYDNALRLCESETLKKEIKKRKENGFI